MSTAELESVRKTCHAKVKDSKLVTCVPGLVRVEIMKSKVKSMVVVIQFPEDYPNHEVLLELKSKTLGDKLLEGLTKVCEEEARKYLGEPQIMLVLKLISNFMDENPLCCCADEISSIKNGLLNGNDRMKLKQKNSTIVLNLKEDMYYYSCSLVIPDEFPETQVQIESTNSNFPESFCKVFLGHAREIARQCVEPPLNRKRIPKNAPPFVPKPSLLPVVKFLSLHVHRYPTEKCSCCNQRCFPDDPDDVVQDENHDLHIERIYCGHLYHLKCLLEYMKTPPFTGGKKCLVCGKRVFHDKYKVTPELAESRWAHEQAMQREIEEIAEFLS